ncbi:YceI family protein [Acidipropionibacterium virtanenii]|uniref:Protein YceI n=1 Tax=Acidipropionibacterium virtanenii TaxID=2057246 RepID=A0A344UQA2_9ACTN|nr:YceI family protein [Acidipropionibacterium virtanenii]AXE37450.1 Protein YceI [Acidipropionibacterium virtanenii]
MTSLAELNGSYTLDPAHTRLGFVTRHAMVTKVRGSFTDFEGAASGNGADPSSAKVSVTIKTDSFTTGVADRDGHIKSGDFLEVDKFPEITFVSTSAAVKGEDLELTGDLTIKGVTKSVTIPFEFDGEAKDPFGNTRIGFEGKLKISRKDFGITWNAALETGGVLVSDDVTLELEVSAIKQA